MAGTVARMLIDQEGRSPLRQCSRESRSGARFGDGEWEWDKKLYPEEAAFVGAHYSYRSGLLVKLPSIS